MRHLCIPLTAPRAPRPGRIPPDLGTTGIDEIRAGLEQGRFRVVDVAEAVLDRIGAREPFLNALVSVNQCMVEDAVRLDDERRSGRPLGPLHGIPIVIKDNMNEAGQRMTAGYAGFAREGRVVDPAGHAFNGIDLVPERDATVVANLRAVGALIIGRSNLPDFALDALRAGSSHNGDTLNAYNPRFAPGGSSTGSATAVAVGFAVGGLGTDTAGSVLFPASAQSLVGLKPSFGLVPGDGIYPGLPSHHDVVGPITRTVRDAALLLDALVGEAGGRHAGALRKGALSGRMVGLFEPDQWVGPLHPDIAEHYRRMVAVIEGLGARTVPVVLGDTDWVAEWNARPSFTTCNSYLAGIDDYLAGLGGDNPRSRAVFRDRTGFDIGLGGTAPLFAMLADPGRNVGLDDPRLREVMAAAERLRGQYERILAAKGIDALCLPRSISPLPDLDSDTHAYFGDQVIGTRVNELGLPAITVPAGFLDDGRPVAIDFVGRAIGTDAEILAFAHDFEQATHLRRPPSEHHRWITS